MIKLTPSRSIPNPSEYIRSLIGELSSWAYTEQDVVQWKGKWRESVFHVPVDYPLDLEIGTGNGSFFAYRGSEFRDRKLVGLELKFKPLIQTIRHALRLGCHDNVKVARFHAQQLELIFDQQELNDVFIFFPDPWPRTRSFKHRLIQDEFLRKLHSMQRPGSTVSFKTDHAGYFEWALERFERSSYQITQVTRDLHASPYAAGNFVTQFEKLWKGKGLPINWIQAVRV